MAESSDLNNMKELVRNLSQFSYDLDEICLKYVDLLNSFRNNLNFDSISYYVSLSVCDFIYSIKQEAMNSRFLANGVQNNFLGIDRDNKEVERTRKNDIDSLKKENAVIDSTKKLLKREIRLFWFDNASIIKKAIEDYNSAHPDNAMDIKQVPFDMLKDPLGVCQRLGIEPSKKIKYIALNNGFVGMPNLE